MYSIAAKTEAYNQRFGSATLTIAKTRHSLVLSHVKHGGYGGCRPLKMLNSPPNINIPSLFSQAKFISYSGCVYNYQAILMPLSLLLLAFLYFNRC